jgi:hypothetical protein
VAPLAERTGERYRLLDGIRPTNLAMSGLSVEVEGGEAAEPLRLAEHVDHGRSPSIERRVAFLLEQASAYAQRREFSSARLLLQRASREAPEDLA